MADEGTYDVVVSNSCDSVTSAPAVLTVSHKVQEERQPPS